jgi:hypothetical protein
MFYIVNKYFSLIFNEVLIFLHRWLNSTHTNCLTATREVFNYILYGYSFISYALKIKICYTFDNQGTTNLLRGRVYNKFLFYYIWGSWKHFPFHIFMLQWVISDIIIY